MGDEAGDWWRQLSQYAEVVRESYFAAPGIAKQGPIEGSRYAAQPVPQARRRVHLRRPAGEQARADARLPDDAGLGRPRAGAAQLVARGDEAAGARREAGRERGGAALGLVVGLGRLERRRARPGQADRGLRLPLGPRPEPLQRPVAAGKGFNTSLTQGQLTLPAGTRCTLYGRPITESTISSLTPVTGDPDVAFSAAFARAVTSLQVKLKAKQVADAERAVVARPLRRQLRAATERRWPRRTRAPARRAG